MSDSKLSRSKKSQNLSLAQNLLLGQNFRPKQFFSLDQFFAKATTDIDMLLQV